MSQLLVVLLAALSMAPMSLSADTYELVVVRPGGPSSSEEAQVQVSRLIEEIGARAGWDSGSATANYFNQDDKALAHIAENRPEFLLTSPGFYLANRIELDLHPINQILINGKSTHRYFVVAQKGKARSLDDLVGGTIIGSPLAEPEFVERVVFRRRLSFDSDVTTEYGRALSSLRRLSRGEVSAVILDATEYQGLALFPFADTLQTIFTSTPIPNTGVFALANTTATAAAALGGALEDFCATGEGASICEVYQISGFAKAPEGVFDVLVGQYEASSSRE